MGVAHATVEDLGRSHPILQRAEGVEPDPAMAGLGHEAEPPEQDRERQPHPLFLGDGAHRVLPGSALELFRWAEEYDRNAPGRFDGHPTRATA